MKTLLSSRRGGLAPIAAIVGTVLVLAAGSAVDIGRAARLRSLLQDNADNAALAGATQTSSAAATASAQAYVNAAVAGLTDKPTVSAQYSYDNSNPASSVMSVTLTANMPTTLMSAVMSSIPLTVSAKASAVVMKQFNVSLNHINSDAADHDALYAFGFDPTKRTGTTLYKFAPTSSNTDGWTCVFANTNVQGCAVTLSTLSQNTSPIPVLIPWADNVAFAFSNQTETGGNCYGMSNNYTTWYYSTRVDSTGQYHDFPTTNINWCGFSTSSAATDGSGATIVDNYRPTNGATSNPNYANQCLTCLGVQTNNGAYYGCPSPLQGPYNNNGNMQCYNSSRRNWSNAPRYNPPSGAQWNMTMQGDAAQDYGYVYPTTASRNPVTIAPINQACDGSSVTYSWDDNGGGSDAMINTTSSSADDDDHNDLTFTITCSRVVGQSGARLTG